MRADVEGRRSKAVDIAWNFAGFDGSHHKAWVIDQMVRALLGDDYESWIRDWKSGPDGPDSFTWDEGIAP